MKNALLISLFVLISQIAQAHPGHDESSPLLLAAAENPGTLVTKSSLPESQVTISEESGFRWIRGNGVPNHETGQFPGRGNPNRITAQSHSFRVTLTPRTNAVTRDARGAWFGVALNGVPFEPGTAEFWNGQPEWVMEAKSGFINLGIDASNAHVQPTGAYHYHGLPTGLIKKLGGEGTKMVLVGYAADGFPIYTSWAHSVATNASSALKQMRSSWQLKKGTRDGGPGGTPDGKYTRDFEYVRGSGDLDECNGRFGVTPEYPRGTYYYCITEEFPQLARSWRGTPDASFTKRGMGGGPGGRGPGRPGGPGGLGGPGNRPPPPPFGEPPQGQ
ncbi:MAG: hypothetical protein RLY20_1991 [Verrucomicrobiota bacterium]|jgi:hypothetical protein